MLASALAAIYPLAQYAQVAAMGGATKYCTGYYSSAGTETSVGYNVVPGVECWDGEPQYAGIWLVWVASSLFLIALAALVYRLVSRRSVS